LIWVFVFMKGWKKILLKIIVVGGGRDVKE